ncbi:MAG: hypothetical protein K9H64_22350 [Bacteroidales bacterium]|nr:hypothetical protein [Bacteroidales bacterium]MCF8456387.1 hypothetical protein [Bacteroidales bacterium]
MIELGSLGLMLLFILIDSIYNREERINASFSKEIGFMLLALFLSMYVANTAHGQSFQITFIAQRHMYFYIFYFFLHGLRLRPNDVVKIIVGLGILISLLYLVQYVAYPRELFRVRISDERGTLRIFFPGQSFIFMTFYFSLLKFFEKYKYPWLILTGLTFVIIILLGSRLILLTTVVISGYFLLTSDKVRSKLLLIPVGIMALLVFLFVFQGIFTQLVDISKGQQANFAEDVRVRAAVFFLTEFFPNTLSYILGNGVESLNSEYGIMVYQIRDELHFFQGDIGIIGDYTQFGVIFVFVAASIYIKTLTAKYPYEYKFLYYYMLFITLLMLMSGDFGNVGAYLPILMILYVIDVAKHDAKFDKINEGDNNPNQGESGYE